MNSQTSISIPLSAAAHSWARLFSSKQINVEQGKQVYLNTLSVFAVDDYLSSLGITTDLNGSNSWYPSPTSPNHTADLNLPQVGTIECCPILADRDHFSITDTARIDRIAYLAIHLDESLSFASIIGFVSLNPELLSKSIALTDIEPIADFTNYLGHIRDGYQPLKEEPDSPLVTNLLAEFEERSIPAFIAFSYHILNSDRKPREKQLNIAQYLDNEVLALSGSTRDDRSDGNDAESIDYDREDELDDLSSDWIDKISAIWSK
jgi:hypothetical protein